jgi:LPS export ABC transporter permease LptG
MSRLTLYLNRVVLVRFIVVLFAVAGFAVLFDLLDSGGRVVRRSDGATWPLLRYVVVRLPTLLTELLPMVTLVAALLAAIDLLRFRELVVLWNAGVSRLGMVLRLWPMALALLVGKLAIDDVAVPATIPQLRALRIAEFKPLGLPGSGVLWVRAGDDVVRLPADAAATGRLRDVLIVARDPQGRILEQVEAASAEPGPRGWLLRDVVRQPASARPTKRLAELEWPVHLELDKLALMAKLPRELRFHELRAVFAADGFGMGATDGHRTWLHGRVAGAFGPPLMLLLAFALVRGYARVGMVMPLIAKSLAGGFVFLIGNGLLVAFAEVGLVPPLLGAWLVPVTFALIVAILAGALEPGRYLVPARRPAPA